MRAVSMLRTAAVTVALAALAACGGASGVPSGAQRNYVPPTTPPLSGAQQVQFSISLPAAIGAGTGAARRPQNISSGTQSAAVVLAALNGQTIPPQAPTVFNVSPSATNCSPAPIGYTCNATVEGASGVDAFNVTLYSQPNGAGQVLSTGTVFAPIGTANSDVNITNGVAVTLSPIATGLQVIVSPSSLNVGTAVHGAVVVQPLDASGAVIFTGISGNVLLSVPPADGVSFAKGSSTTLPLHQFAPFTYDGSISVSGPSLTISATLQGSSPLLSATASIPFTFPPTPSPSPTPTGFAPAIYVLNQGAGSAPTVSVYALNATGNAAPIRTIDLNPSKILTLQSIAVDGSGNLYVGFINSANLGEVDVFAYNAAGNAAPVRTLLSDPNDPSGNDTTLDPVQLAIAQNGELLTVGTTKVGGNFGNTAALVYAADASGKAVPIDAWNFSANLPQISTSSQAQASVAGLAFDAATNYYVAGALKNGAFSSLPGIFVAPSTAAGTSVTPAFTITGSPIPAQPTIGSIAGVALDGTGNIYESQYIAGQTAFTGTINVYAAASANLRATISDPADLDINPQQGLTTLPIAVNGQQIYIANGSTNSVVVYPASASGVTKPSQTIAGSNSGLNSPIGIAVGFSGP